MGCYTEESSPKLHLCHPELLAVSGRGEACGGREWAASLPSSSFPAHAAGSGPFRV